jgi:hypothetical protein
MSISNVNRMNYIAKSKLNGATFAVADVDPARSRIRLQGWTHGMVLSFRAFQEHFELRRVDDYEREEIAP